MELEPKILIIQLNKITNIRAARTATAGKTGKTKATTTTDRTKVLVTKATKTNRELGMGYCGDGILLAMVFVLDVTGA